ncbi:DUF2442 domain-containing protein [Acidithiobacillus caldus]|jgi:hypothetical protein|uniref:DUF2442 domain-containing protein n=2 Tax=Acidithiobacillus caldus TaxID=33059 RepID=F9ZQN2_ACICS|nr:DUF2442 domain-containing protein [Acidithiobacillus caldus]AEK58632.1 conserved hypothetical protein [Acidithiobacillus caldus SM-1]AUW33189.1 DUF2442 domain-containing protein [Acidithiobacillus caldus]MBU2763455.1 DUF2442 domain-containing protein [Acidithiobacillus caldus]MBU2783526.1 DUF2442 domain-containing protein [Acidithiobacillus caldus]MBU2801531.1 DUF2442 domain-containing protein [Acidithiobacillus caldus]
MSLHIVQLEVVPTNDDQRLLRLVFSNGESGVVNLADELDGPVFGPLFQRGRFSEATLHPLFRTVTWPNGADLAPEFLLDLLRRQRGHAA